MSPRALHLQRQSEVHLMEPNATFVFAVLWGLVLGVPILYLHYRLRTSRPSDGEAIDALLNGRQLRKLSVTRNNNYWGYWVRGKVFSLSNLARIYVVVGEDQGGSRHEIHIAFDNWPPSKGQLQVLQERHMSQRDVQPHR